MSLKINSIKVVIEAVDTETNEVIVEERLLGEETKKTRKSRSKASKPDDNDPTPKLTLVEGKYTFNAAAVELIGFEPETKLDIKYEKRGRDVTLVLCEDEREGNRLSKSYTVSCKGQKRERLEKYGTEFVISQYPDKDGFFKLTATNAPEDDIIDVPEIETVEGLDEAGSDIDFDNLNFSFD